MREMFRGTWVALVTPYRDGRVDAEALRRLTRHVMAGGVDGLVPCGCTGEAGLLESREQAEVIRVVMEEAAGRVPVVAGTGTQATSTTIDQSRQAAALGARAAMVITPYYVKPTQEGLYQHYRKVVEEGGLPVVLYNVPGRTGVSLAPETVARLAELAGVVAIKEASGSPEQVTRIRAACDLPILSGDDGMTLALMAVGACGVVSVAANILPAPVVEMVGAFAGGEVAKAQALHLRLAPLFRALFLETNPAPAKMALSLMKIMGGDLRLPLVPVKPETAREIERVLRELGAWPASEATAGRPECQSASGSGSRVR